jgi:FeS assembly SUF system protein
MIFAGAIPVGRSAMISREMDQTNDKPRKLSLNVLPDQEKLSGILARAEASQKSRAESQPSQSEDDMADEGPHVLTAPDDWSAGQKSLHAKVIDVLKSVFDPEIPVNIYDLGLVYDIDVTEQGKVLVKMTLTAPACPVADSMPPEIEAQIQAIPECTFAHVLLVWDPPWDRDRMSEAAKLQLGMI